MCGIAGQFNYGSLASPDREPLLVMREAMHAPELDGKALWCDPTFGIVLVPHGWLAVINLARSVAVGERRVC